MAELVPPTADFRTRSHILEVTQLSVFMRMLYALAAASVAFISLAYQDFAPMWHSIPATLPGHDLWVYACEIALLVACAGVLASRWAIPAVLMIGAYQLVWAILSIAPILANPLTIGAWYGLAEALSWMASTLIIYATLRFFAPGSQTPQLWRRWVQGGWES